MSNKSNIVNPEKWVEKYADYLYNYARFKLPSKEIAEDVVQETFLSALTSVKHFKANSSEKTWLVTILKRRIVDYYRKDSRKADKNISSFKLPFNESGDFENHWLEQRAPKKWEVDDKIQLDEFHQVLQYCLNLLSPKHRVVFMMKVLEEYSSDEVCIKASITPNNLWTIMHRARLQISECVAKKWM